MRVSGSGNETPTGRYGPFVTCLKPVGCPLCGAEVQPGRNRIWCSPTCREAYYANHRWTEARNAAMKAAQRRCVGCGGSATEVDHIRPRLGQSLGVHSCLHHQDNLRALCHDCHLNRRTVFQEAS